MPSFRNTLLLALFHGSWCILLYHNDLSLKKLLLLASAQKKILGTAYQYTQTIKQWNNQTIKQSNNQTIKQSNNQTIKQMLKCFIKRLSNLWKSPVNVCPCLSIPTNDHQCLKMLVNAYPMLINVGKSLKNFTHVY